MEASNDRQTGDTGEALVRVANCAFGPHEQAPSPAPTLPGRARLAGKARTNGIGDAREHAADDAAELAFHVNKIPISAAIEGRGAQEMVGWCCVEIGRIRASHPHPGRNRRWTC